MQYSMIAIMYRSDRSYSCKRELLLAFMHAMFVSKNGFIVERVADIMTFGESQGGINRRSPRCTTLILVPG